MPKTIFAAMLAVALSSPVSSGFAQNASMPCEGLTGSNQERCLKNGPPRDAKHAVAAGSESTNPRASAAMPDTYARSNSTVKQKKQRKLRQ